MIPVNYFRDLPSLTSIDLQYNVVSLIQDHAFSQVPTVTLINLYNNDLATVTTHMFTGLYNLRTLRLMSNPIHTVEPLSFRDQADLWLLAFISNDLHTLDECIFDPHNHPTGLDRAYLYNNAWHCDYNLCWLVRAQQGAWLTVDESESIPRCSTPPTLAGTALTSLSLLDLNCTEPTPNITCNITVAGESTVTTTTQDDQVGE